MSPGSSVPRFHYRKMIIAAAEKYFLQKIARFFFQKNAIRACSVLTSGYWAGHLDRGDYCGMVPGKVISALIIMIISPCLILETQSHNQSSSSINSNISTNSNQPKPESGLMRCQSTASNLWWSSKSLCWVQQRLTNNMFVRKSVINVTGWD